MFSLKNLIQRKKTKTICFLFFLFLLYNFKSSLKISLRDFLYLTRPIWDVDESTGFIKIPQFHSANLTQDELCHLHGWTKRNETGPKVIDAFTFSVELDLLEIRLKELWDIVDLFILVESDKTFTGKSKPLYFNETKNRFSWAEEKLKHFILTGLSSNPASPFDNEGRTRGNIQSIIESLKPNKDDLIIVGDIDEIPYRHTIALLKTCQGWPSGLHLELQNFRYTFEFRLLTTHWRQHVSLYSSTFSYHHGKTKGATLLANSGWHCSFCFPRISDFVFKMTSYSHNDRVTSSDLLKPENIQRRLCDGSDVFNMLPEVFSFRDLITQRKAPPKTGKVYIPEYVLRNSQKFAYLLPGGCLRRG